MTEFNLPPGVTPSMIPWNRPEDVAAEAFWDAFFTACADAGVPFPDDIDDGESPASRMVEIARDIGYAAGYGDGYADSGIESMLNEQREEEV